ncbi:RICIN domain-containing protein [Streptomyces goshikiensis]|uniref:RICIN domain-containing protein n=1 Tax=Streptomyces goshikiensis TaxID=1942 RepID=UPI0036A5DD26
MILLVAGLLDAAPASAEDRPGQYTNAGYHLCMDGRGEAEAGDAVILWPCNGGANQVWHAYGETLVNDKNNLCLDNPGSTTRSGARLILWHCNGGGNQIFRWNKHTRHIDAWSAYLVVDASGGAGTQLVLWGANGGLNQEWTTYNPW